MSDVVDDLEPNNEFVYTIKDVVSNTYFNSDFVLQKGLIASNAGRFIIKKHSKRNIDEIKTLSEYIDDKDRKFSVTESINVKIKF